MKPALRFRRCTGRFATVARQQQSQSQKQLIDQPDRQTCFHPASASVSTEPFVPAIRFVRASWMYSKSQAATSCERAYRHLMGMLTNLISRIFSHAPAATISPAASPSTTVASATALSPTSPAAFAVSPVPAAPAVAPTQPVDVTAILDGLVAKNPQKLDWRKSFVDLMTLVDMDSSLSSRKKLATELHYSGDENDSASMNMWLHKEVITKLAENGGKVPHELLS
jgi:hypothetical protein